MDYEQLGHILESIHPGVTIADSSGVFRFVSNSYLSGRSVKGSDIIGKFADSEEMMKMFSPCVTQMVFESHKRVTTVQKGVDNDETFVTGIPVFKDGELEMIISYSSWEITGFDDLRERYNVLQYQNKKLLDEIELMTGRDGGQRYIAQSSRSRDARRLAGVFCDAGCPCYIYGPTGSGKSYLASTIYGKKGTLYTYDCAPVGEEVIEKELLGRIAKVQKQAQTGGDKQAKIAYEVLCKYKEALEQGKSARTVSFETKDEQKIAHDLFLLTDKPVMYVCNVDEASAVNGNKYVDAVREAVKDEGAEILVVAAKIESEIAEFDTYEERQMFLQEIGLEESGVARLIKSAYKLLNLQTFLTAGPDECRAWTFHKGWKAPQCAGVIHTDFEKGFIRAEVIKYEDYISYGSESAVKEAGKMSVEGKEYIVQDGDIMHFRFNV